MMKLKQLKQRKQGDVVVVVVIQYSQILSSCRCFCFRRFSGPFLFGTCAFGNFIAFEATLLGRGAVGEKG